MFDNSSYFYYGSYVVGFILMMVINLKNHDRFSISKKNAIIYTVYTYICGIIGATLMGLIYYYVHSLLGIMVNKSVCIYGAVVFTPILLMLFPIKKSDRVNAVDMVTPGILLILACSKVGCFINGCCRGFICEEFGILYKGAEVKHFPIQIIETGIMLLILALTQLIIRKTSLISSGKNYPFTFAAYAVSRFFVEFARYYENEEQRNLMLGFTFWQITSIIVFIVCIIILVIPFKKKEKIS